MRGPRAAIALTAFVLAASSRPIGGRAAAQSHDHVAPPPVATPRRAVTGPLGNVSRTATPAIDAGGRLWLAWEEGPHVFVSVSEDEGRTFAAATRVNAEPEPIDANSESRPKIAFGGGGALFVTYTRAGTKPYTGDIRFARSLDGGRTFSPPVTINDDGLDAAHRFDALAVAPDGRVIVAWIDKRDLETAARGGGPYDGAALYYAESRDRGARFSPNRRLADRICECCRLATAFDASGRLAVAWRNVYPGSIRDHALGWIGSDGTPGATTRVTRDDWKIEACPHHGPAMAISASGAIHFVWFTGAGPAGAGVFYARSLDGGRTFSPPRRVGAASASAHASIVTRGREVLIAWKTPGEAGGASVRLERSPDEGATWGTGVEVARTAAASDYPFLIHTSSGVRLSWLTGADGYRYLALPGAPAS
jgi:hypothetical protein